LADNDALGKIAHWELLDCIPQVVGGTWHDVAVLDTLLHRTRRAAAGKSDKLFASPAIAARLLAHLDMAQMVSLPPPEIRALLTDHAGIDPGEQILFGALLVQPSGLLLTGDKRALSALPECLSPEHLLALAGRCICIEQFIVVAIAHLGLAEVQRRMRPYVGRDTAARIIMGSACDATATNVYAALDSYINDIRERADPLLR